MEYQNITFEKADTVGIVTLNRPGGRMPFPSP